LKQKKWELKKENKLEKNNKDFSKIKNILKTEKKLANSEAVEKIMNELKLPFVKNYLVTSEKQAEEVFNKI